MFSQIPFFEKWREELGNYFSLPNRNYIYWPLTMVVLSLFFYSSNLVSKRRNHGYLILSILIFVTFLLTFRKMPSNYLWYYENLFLVMLGLVFLCLVILWKSHGSKILLFSVTSLWALLFVGLVATSLQENRNFPGIFTAILYR